MIQLPPANTANASLLPDLTPLLDVIFIVLVFFLLTAQAPLLQRPLDLPQDQRDSASAGAVDTQRQLLELDASGLWRLDDQLLSLDELPLALGQTERPALDLAIDRQAPLAAFLDLILLLQEQQIEDIRMLMEPAADALNEPSPPSASACWPVVPAWRVTAATLDQRRRCHHRMDSRTRQAAAAGRGRHHQPASAGVTSLPSVGYQRQLSAEGVLTLTPDLLLGTEEMGPPPVLAQLERAGIRIVQLSARSDLQVLDDNLQRLGELLGQPERAQLALEDFHQQLSHLQQQVDQARQGEQPPGVLLLLGQGGTNPLVAGRNTLADWLLRQAGARNLAEHEGYKNLSGEALLALDADWLVLTDRQLRGAEGQQALLAHNPARAGARAFAEHRSDPAGWWLGRVCRC